MSLLVILPLRHCGTGSLVLVVAAVVVVIVSVVVAVVVGIPRVAVHQVHFDLLLLLLLLLLCPRAHSDLVHEPLHLLCLGFARVVLYLLQFVATDFVVIVHAHHLDFLVAGFD